MSRVAQAMRVNERRILRESFSRISKTVLPVINDIIRFANRYPTDEKFAELLKEFVDRTESERPQTPVNFALKWISLKIPEGSAAAEAACRLRITRAKKMLEKVPAAVVAALHEMRKDLKNDFAPFAPLVILELFDILKTLAQTNPVQALEILTPLRKTNSVLLGKFARDLYQETASGITLSAQAAQDMFFYDPSKTAPTL